MADSTVTIVGNLTRDPELRYTASGQARATLGVAVSRRWQNRLTNEWEEQTSFLNAVCWGQLAENVADSLHKGARVVVTGRLDQRTWENEAGERRSVVEIVADDVGASLRWATAVIERNERREPHSAAHAAAPAASTRGRKAAVPVIDDEDYDDEPF